MYSEAQLTNMFSRTYAELHHPLFTNDYRIEFINLPAGATVVEVKRVDLKPVKLTRITDSKYSLNSSDYSHLRHNWGHSISVTYSINNQKYTRVYSETFGEIE